MNKLRLNNKIHNNIKFIPINMDIEFKDEIEEQKWAEDKYLHLVNDNLTRHICYVRNKQGKDKHMITIWSDTEYAYLVVAFRTEWNTTQMNISMQLVSDDVINDFKAIAKLIHYNITSINKGYKDLIIDARDYMLKNKIHIEDENEREEHTELN